MPSRRSWKWRLVLLVLAPMVATVVAGNAPVSAQTSGPSTTALTGDLRALVASPGGPPGAVAIVQVGPSVSTTTIGKGDVVAATPPSTEDVMRIASVAKAYSGAIALAMVSRHLLSLGDTIGRLLPTLPKSWSAVDLAQLLQHTSGLPDYIKSPKFLSTIQADPQQSLSPVQLLQFVFDEPPGFRPGTRYEYSDTDNIVVGLMVEAASGQPYNEALDRYVVEPLHLRATTLPANPSMPEPFLHGYQIEGSAPPEDVTFALNPALAWASGGMTSTPAELNRFIRAYVAGTLFSRAVRSRQFRFRPGESGPPGPGANGAGLALFRYQTPCGTVYGHTGNYPGYTQFAAATGDGTRSVVVSINEQVNPTQKSALFTMLRAADQAAVCAALHR